MTKPPKQWSSVASFSCASGSRRNDAQSSCTRARRRLKDSRRGHSSADSNSPLRADDSHGATAVPLLSVCRPRTYPPSGAANVPGLRGHRVSRARFQERVKAASHGRGRKVSGSADQDAGSTRRGSLWWPDCPRGRPHDGLVSRDPPFSAYWPKNPPNRPPDSGRNSGYFDRPASGPESLVSGTLRP
jgi:hypothetical protein